MSVVETIRNRVDTRLDQWEASALALQAQLVSTRGEIQERIETHKERLARLTSQMEALVDGSEALALKTRNRLHEGMENLKLQLASEGADARDTFVKQKNKIAAAMAEVEARIDEDLEQTDVYLTDVVDRWIHEEIALEAELEAAEMHFDLEQARLRARLDDVFQEKKRRIMSKLDALRLEIDIERRAAANTFETFESELSNGMHQVKDAFRQLVS